MGIDENNLNLNTNMDFPEIKFVRNAISFNNILHSRVQNSHYRTENVTKHNEL